MRYFMYPVIDKYELEKEIRLQYDGLNIDYLFFGYTDSEFNYLGISEDWNIFYEDDEDRNKKKIG